MGVRYPPETFLPILAETTVKIGSIIDGVPQETLATRPSAEEWSSNEILAHLRSCVDVWVGRIDRMLIEDHPTIRAINPTTYILQTNYPTLAFRESFAVFSEERAILMPRLQALTPDQWARTALVVGAGAPLTHSVQGYADALARHERAHIRQMSKAIAAIQTLDQAVLP